MRTLGCCVVSGKHLCGAVISIVSLALQFNHPTAGRRRLVRYRKDWARKSLAERVAPPVTMAF